MTTKTWLLCFTALSLAACGGGGDGSGDGGGGGGGADGGSNVTTLASNQGNPYALTVDATNAYWVNFTDNGALMSVPLAGGTPKQLAALANPAALAIDGTNAYVAVQGDRSTVGGSIVAVPLAGGAPRTLISNLPLPNNVIVDDTNVYWSDEQAVLGLFVLPKNSVAASSPPVMFGCNMTTDNSSCIPWENSPEGGGIASYLSLQQDATHLYWADGPHVWSIAKGTLNGTPTQIAKTGANGNQMVAVVGTAIYWTDGASVWASTVTGGTPRQMITNLNGSLGITADGTNVYYGIENGRAPVAVIPVSASGKTESDLQVFADTVGGESPEAIASDSSFVYWTGSDGVTGGVYKAHK